MRQTKTQKKENRTPEIGLSGIVSYPIPRTEEQVKPATEIVYWEEHNPRSLINVVSDKMTKLLRQLPPDLLAMPEKELRKKLEPSWIQEQLRLAFWDEYFLTMDNDEKFMRMEAVHSKVCSKEFFYQQIEIPLFLLFMIKPPQGYMLKMRSLLDIGLERFREVLQLPLHLTNGNVDTRLIGEIVKIVALVDNRVKGAVTQRIQLDSTQRSMNVNVNYEPPKSATEINDEIKQIQREIKELTSGEAEEALFGEQESSEDFIGEVVTVKEEGT